MKTRAPATRQPSRPRPRAPQTLAYPFSAIVGQEEMKLALLLNVVDASIGGVLIMGHRGTGKSTAVRALADLLPKIERVRGCFYNCDPADEVNLCDDCYARAAAGEKLARERSPVPVADLPLGATEDRVCGAVHFERALAEGVRAFEPGLLARANRGFLYIDEVNLLDDHLIDLLLDVSVTGRNLVEREGLSVEHPARFVLVGSGNPEEGELRPQLLDRFGLHVEVMTAGEAEDRVAVVERREAFGRDPEQFRALYAGEQESLRRRLARARARLREVELPHALLKRIAELCGQLKIDGHRGELTIARAARSLAAFEGRMSVSADDVRRVATMALRHRLRRDPLEQTGSGARVRQQLDDLFPADSDAVETGPAGNSSDEDRPGPSSPRGGTDGDKTGGIKTGGRSRKEGRNPLAQGDEPPRGGPAALDARLPQVALGSTARASRTNNTRPGQARRRAETRQSSESALRGRYVRAVITKTPGARLALDATLRAAALDARRVDEWTSGRVEDESISASTRPLVHASHSLRYKRFNRKAGTLFIFAVDASGSMGLNRIAQAKGALARLLRQSYIKRDRVALISFRGQGADVMLRPSGSAARAKILLDSLGVGGATPLPAGIASALEIARRERRRGVERIVLLLFTDGRANVSLAAGETLNRAVRQQRIEGELESLGAALLRAQVTTVVVDTRPHFTSGGEGHRLAELVGGRYIYLPSAAASDEQFTSLNTHLFAS